VFGNAVATAGFTGLADGSRSKAGSAVELGASPWPVFDIAASAIHYPFFYSSEERADLGALAVPQTFDASGRLADWAAGFVRGTHTDTLALLKDMVAGVARGDRLPEPRGGRARRRHCRPSIAAGARAATSPCCSPRRRAPWASARIISGYLYNPDRAPAPKHGPEGSALGAGSNSCVDRDLPAGRGLDHLRPDQPGCRRLQSHPARRSAASSPR
jgi:hypothetical protein